MDIDEDEVADDDEVDVDGELDVDADGGGIRKKTWPLILDGSRLNIDEDNLG